MGNLKISLIPYTYQLKHSFNLAIYSRTTTPAVLLKIQTPDITAWGEASLPPYLGETQESVMSFINRFNLERFSESDSLETILHEVDNFEPNNTAAKAAIDIALHNLKAQLGGISLQQQFGIHTEFTLPTSYTIGIDSPENVASRATEAKDFNVLKIKLGGANDREMIAAVRSVTDKPIYVDVNQGWKTLDQAEKESDWLAKMGVVLIEQPFPKDWLEETARLREKSPLPLFADESCQRLADVEKMAQAFQGINIKLMKCTGMAEAAKMISLARKLNLKIMMGSMTESSVATLAANTFAPLVDFIDLDGPWLIANNPFETPKLQGGVLMESSPKLQPEVNL